MVTPTDRSLDRDVLRLHLLVLRCQAGDERAFARLFDEFGAHTFRYLEGLVSDGAEDVHREVLLLRYRDDLSYAEIAKVAGCSVGTVRSRIHNARLRVRKRIDHSTTGHHTTAPITEA